MITDKTIGLGVISDGRKTPLKDYDDPNIKMKLYAKKLVKWRLLFFVEKFIDFDKQDLLNLIQRSNSKYKELEDAFQAKIELEVKKEFDPDSRFKAQPKGNPQNRGRNAQ